MTFGHVRGCRERNFRVRTRAEAEAEAEAVATQAIQGISSESFLRCEGEFGNELTLTSNSDKSSDFQERP